MAHDQGRHRGDVGTILQPRGSELIKSSTRINMWAWQQLSWFYRHRYKIYITLYYIALQKPEDRLESSPGMSVGLYSVGAMTTNGKGKPIV